MTPTVYLSSTEVRLSISVITSAISYFSLCQNRRKKLEGRGLHLPLLCSKRFYHRSGNISTSYPYRESLQAGAAPALEKTQLSSICSSRTSWEGHPERSSSICVQNPEGTLRKTSQVWKDTRANRSGESSAHSLRLFNSSDLLAASGLGKTKEKVQLRHAETSIRSLSTIPRVMSTTLPDKAHHGQSQEGDSRNHLWLSVTPRTPEGTGSPVPPCGSATYWLRDLWELS